jgi:hypothetical protein
VLSLLASALAYELVAPLFALSALATWQVSRNSDKPPTRLALALFMLTYLGSLLAVGLLKALTTIRGPSIGYEQQIFAFDVAKNLRTGLQIALVSYGIALPKRAEQILIAQPDVTILLWSVFFGIATSVYIYRATRNFTSSLSTTSAWLKAIVIGLVVFTLGFSVFAAFGDIPFTTTGVNNRIAVAASVGTAFVFVGVIGLVASSLPRTWMQRVILCSIIGLVCASGFAVINGEARFWITAYAKEREVIADIRSRFPTLGGTVLLLDGVCSYIGPAPVLNNAWVLTDALRIAYRVRDIEADIVRPDMEIGPTMLSTWSWDEKVDHSYEKHIFVYDYAQKTVYPVGDAAAARNYLRTYHSDCPPAEEGFGAKVF